MLIERLSSEKAAAEEETRRILHRAFSEAEANEMGDLKKLVAQRDAEVPTPPPRHRPRPRHASPHPHIPPTHAHTHSRSLRR